MKRIQTGIIALLLIPFWGGNNSSAQSGGVLPGSFSVSSQGGANYELPLEVPPGLQGIAPQLSIGYSSQNENGILGQGFAISGLSAISRTGAVPAQDGFRGGINYNEYDRFSLDGKRLLNTNTVAGGYGGDGATYCTEVQNWTKVVAHGDCGSGPCSFTVTLKNGITLEYGATDDSQIPAVGSIFESGEKENSIRKWLLTKMTDLNGNYITYTYSQQPKNQNNQPAITSTNNGQTYLQTIAYTGNTNLSPQRFVQFYYEARPDTLVDYVGGGMVQTQARLVSIQTEVLLQNGTTETVSNYVFTYNSNGALGVSCLASIQLFDAKGAYLPAQTFNWSSGVNGFHQSQTNFTGNLNNSGWVGDFNGDGLTDLITYTYNESVTLDSLYFSTGKGFENGIGLSSIFLDNLTPQLADFNADGLADIIGLGYDTAIVWLCNGNGFNGPVGVGDIAFSGENSFWIADFNGDGRADLMVEYGFQFLVYLSDGVVFKNPITLYTALNDEALLLGDFNGDGLTDAYTSYGTSIDSLYLSNFSNGQNFSPGIAVPRLNYTTDSWVSDFNGDGIDDILIQYGFDSYLNYANGQGFDSAIVISELELGDNGNWVGDYNGDGRADLYVNGGGQENSVLYLNQFGSSYADGFEIPSAGLSESNVWIGDFNGDGSTDLFSNQPTSLLLFSADTTETAAAHSHLTNLLVEIDNGIGSTTTISYLPITNNKVYEKSSQSNDTIIEGIQSLNRYQASAISPVYSSSYPVQTIQTSTYVVDNYTVKNGSSDSINYTYHYTGAKVDMNGYGWLGYHQMTKIDSTAKRISQQTMHQLFPLTGSLDEASFYTLDNQLMAQINNEYAVIDTSLGSNGNAYRVLKTATKKTQYDYGVYAFAQQERYYYDSFNNVVQTQEWDAADSTAVLYKNYTYSNNTANWQLGYLQEGVYASDSIGNNMLSAYGYEYDQTTKDTLVKKQWVSGNTWIETNYVYDGFGNSTATVNQTGDTTYTTYDPFYHCFPTKITYPPNAQGERMFTTLHTDPAFGLADTAFDVNGHLTVAQYDGFGRNTATYITNPSGALVLASAISDVLNGANGYIQLSTDLVDWSSPIFDTSWAYYDALGQNIKTVTTGFGAKKSQSDMVYDMSGNVLQISTPYFSGDSPLWTRLKYDPYGRIIQASQPLTKSDSIVSTIAYVGQSMQIANQSAANSKNTQVFFTTLNGKREYTHLVDQNLDTIYFGYDLIGRMLKTWNPSFTINQYTYDGLSRPLTATNISLGKSTFFYNDAAGEELVISALNDSIFTRSDALGRPIFQKFSNGDSLILEYDLPGYTNSNEALCKVTAQPNLVYEYNYDVLGLTSQTTLTFDGQTYQTEANYNPSQNISTFTFPDNSVQRYTYSAQNYLTGIDLIGANKDSSRMLTLTNYNAADDVLQMVFGNGVQNNQTFLANGNLSGITLVDPAQANLLKLAYQWNLDLQIDTLIRTGKISETIVYNYDPTGRLLGAKANDGQTLAFSYNSFGNMTQNDSLKIAYTHFQPTSVLSEQGDTLQKLVYNVQGNLIEKTLFTSTGVQTYTYSYNLWNQLTTVILNADTLYTYLYDYEGRLLKEVNFSTQETTLYPCDNYAIITSDTSSTIKKSISDGDQLIAVVIADDNQNQTVTYYHQNNVMSTVLTTTEAGQSETEIAYNPYGGVREQVTTDQTQVDYLFGSKEFEEESDLYYFTARYYDPNLGNFTTADNQLGGSPLKVDSYNNYAFALNNPVKNADPSGHNLGEALLETAAALAVGAAEVTVDALSGGTATPEIAALDIGTEALIEAAEGAEEVDEVVQATIEVSDPWDVEAEDEMEVDDDKSGDWEPEKPKKTNLRSKYMGGTPQKNSPVGRKVINRLIGEGKYIRRPNGDIFEASNGKWYEVKVADMSHKEAAVRYWNRKGYLYGPKSPKVRAFMNRDRNYFLDHKRLNRSEGGAMRERYRNPAKQAKVAARTRLTRKTR